TVLDSTSEISGWSRMTPSEERERSRLAPWATAVWSGSVRCVMVTEYPRPLAAFLDTAKRRAGTVERGVHGEDADAVR
ncbi:hypothetical protein, partial [Sedimentibacter sp. B4]|uniref:hypothetical protein n=1 Tax=Sedimentibacter sp. B4 TaxID=304766 RepID=UPI001E3D4581